MSQGIEKMVSVERKNMTTECKGRKKERKLEKRHEHFYFKLMVLIIWGLAKFIY